MPKGSRKHESESSCDDSSSSSSSSESETQFKILINQKHHKKDSESESCSNSDKKHKRHRKTSKKSKSSKSCTESDIDFYNFSFDDIYKYYKCELLKDESLMIAGSDAYNYANNNVPLTIPTGFPVTFNEDQLKYNVEHKYFNAPFVVRKSGVYIIFFSSNSDQSSQYTIFVNGIPTNYTTAGNNSGAGQTVIRQLLNLNKDDTVIIRNWKSASPALVAQLNVGGLQLGNNEVFLMAKVAALPNPEYECVKETWKSDCLSRRKKYLFRKLAEKLSCDKELMIQGFNIYGSYTYDQQQIVLTETDVIFNTSTISNGLTWTPNTSQIIIHEDGIYKVFFRANTNVAAQFAFAVNGIPYEPSTQGSNRGAGQISIRTLLELKAGMF